MTGRSPMRSVSAPHGTSVIIPPPVTAAKARPISPRLRPYSLRRAGASDGQAHAQGRERAGADRARGEDDPAVAGLTRARPASARGDGGPWPRCHTAPSSTSAGAPPASGRRSAPSTSPRRRCGCAPPRRASRASRGVERDRAERAPHGVGRRPLPEERRPVAGEPSCAARAGVRQPVVDRGHRGGRRGGAGDRRLHAGVDGLAQLARVAQPRRGSRAGARAAAARARATGRGRRASRGSPRAGASARAAC